MSRFALFGATAALLALSLPALAQSGAMGAQTNGTAGQSAMAATDMPTTCQGMMDKAHPKMDAMADGSKKTMAMKQMNMANTAMTAGREKSCMTHMKTAMHDMM